MSAAIRPQNQTPAVSQALMKFVELEDIIHTQGWIKIEPTYGERFNSTYHSVYQRRSEPNMLPDRVIELYYPGYIRQLPTPTGNSKTQVRLAVVDVSS